MPLIEYTLFGRVDRVETAIQRIKAFDPIGQGYADQPYYVAYSGGKDSDAIRILCRLAGVRHELWHNHTTVDAPETVRYVRSIPEMHISRPAKTMWQMIVDKGIPPTRIRRYCCDVLKEGGGKDRVVMTGVRWAESKNRKSNRGLAEVLGSRKNRKLILNQDNDDARRMYETCKIKGKRVINPIIDWSDADVWELLDAHGCKSNPQYQCGHRRVGCVGCPMSTKQAEELEARPKYKEAYIRSFGRMVESREARGLSNKDWKNGQSVYDWWIASQRWEDKQLEGQTEMMLEETDINEQN